LNCQRFGHTSDRCKNEKVCFRCGSQDCSEEVCKEEPKCVNCGESHPSSSKQCSVWLKEKEIQQLKVEKHHSYPDARKLYNTQHPSISYAAALKKKSRREISCQTDPVTPAFKQNKSNSTTPNNLDTPSESLKQVISASPKPQVPPKPKETIAPKNVKKQLDLKREKDSESSKKLPKPIIKSDRIPKGMRDPISVHNRYNILEEERMDTSSSHSRSHSLSPSRTRTNFKYNASI
jgi:hypothetical protein